MTDTFSATTDSSQSPAVPKLSICITTFNRATFIGATLESILAQATDDCEVIVLDGGSADNTQRVVSEYTARFDRLRYVRQDINNGFDRDCDRVVELARGEYCWLMPDDDLLKAGAIQAVLEALRRDFSVVIVNSELKNFGMTKVLQRRRIDIESDRVYRPDQLDGLFVDGIEVLKYVGGIVVKRAIWRARERVRYYGSLYIHIGVIFQERLPGDTLLIAEPFISYRMTTSNNWWSRVIELWWIKWPTLVWSLAISESAKKKICVAEPWRDIGELLLWRGMGCYSLTEYWRLIRPRLRSFRDGWVPALVALLPGVLVHAAFMLYYSTTGRAYRGVYQPDAFLEFMRGSRFHFRNWRVFRREL
jgi:abequosyltransferase